MLSSRTTVYAAILFLSLNAGMLTADHLNADIIFGDLTEWNLKCAGLDSCQEDRSSNNLGGEYTSDVSCHCDGNCTLLGTCCADSEYRNDGTGGGLGTGGFSCRNPNRDSGLETVFLPGDALFMMDTCRSNWDGDVFVQELCLGSARAMNDPFLLIPVTSPKTGITYRNYFCFACNEDFDTVSPVLWKLKILSGSTNVTGALLTNLQYDETMKQWTIRGTGAVVTLLVNIPENLKQFKILCEESAIQTCAKNWTDLVTKEKCEAYMALVFKGARFKAYRNPHCAICNFLDVSEISCKPIYAVGYALPPLIGEFHLQLESRCLRYMIFDPFSDRCRDVKCIQNQVWDQGECRVRT